MDAAVLERDEAARRSMHPVVHVTTVHPPLDPRIFFKECRSLAEAGFPVTLIAPDAPSGAQDGVRFHSIGVHPSRLERMLFGPWDAFRAARAVGGQVFHLHDPELLWLGWLLKILGYRVVYDMHEDVPRQVLAKPWVPRWARGPVGRVIGLAERLSASVFDALVCATPGISARFARYRTTVVRNFPVPQEFSAGKPYPQRPPLVAYVGALVPERGLWTMLEAAPLLRDRFGATLVLGGRFASRELEEAAREHPGWSAVDFRGWLGRSAVDELLGSSRVGLVPLLPTAAYQASLAVKMFEYMAAGIPVVASDFPLWREIVEGAGCGVLIPPGDAQTLTTVVGELLADPLQAEAMGRRGRDAVRQRYSWEGESRALIALYDSLLGVSSEGGGHDVRAARRA